MAAGEPVPEELWAEVGHIHLVDLPDLLPTRWAARRLRYGSAGGLNAGACHITQARGQLATLGL